MEWVCIDDGSSRDILYRNVTTSALTLQRPAEFQDRLWDDGSKMYYFRGRCIVCMNKLTELTMTFSKDGSRAFALALCKTCFFAECATKCLNFSLSHFVSTKRSYMDSIYDAFEAKKGFIYVCKSRRDNTRMRSTEFKGIPGEYLSWGFKLQYDEYYGTLREGVPNGHGIKTFSDGSNYVGNFTSGKFDDNSGTACLTRANGWKYTGCFSSGKRNGSGLQQYTDGTEYSGEFTMGFEHGSGTMTRIDNNVFIGSFKYGRRFGRGIVKSSDGTITESMEYADEKPLHLTGKDADPMEVSQQIESSTTQGQPLPLTFLSLLSLSQSISTNRCSYKTEDICERFPEHLKRQLTYLTFILLQIPRDSMERCIEKYKRIFYTRLTGENSADMSSFQLFGADVAFSDVKLSPSAERFASVLDACCWMKNSSINVCDTMLMNDDATLLLYMTCGHKLTEYLRLSNVGLRSNHHFELLSGYLATNLSQLSVLDICYNAVSEQGCFRLSSAFANLKRLQLLKMRCCRLCDDAVAILSSCLPASLTTVDFSMNCITSVGMTSIIALLTACVSLTNLDLEFNKIDSQGSHQLSEYLSFDYLSSKRHRHVLMGNNLLCDADVAQLIMSRQPSSLKQVLDDMRPSYK